MTRCRTSERLLSLIVAALILCVGGIARAQLRESLNRSSVGKKILDLNPRLLTDEVRKKLAAGQFQPIAAGLLESDRPELQFLP